MNDDNMIKFPNFRITPKEVAEAVTDDVATGVIDELYVVAIINGRPMFYLSGDIRGAVFAGQTLTDQVLMYMKGEIK